MKAILLAWFVTMVVFLVIDAVWLGVVARSFYRNALGSLMLDQPKLHIAALFYVGYAFAVVLLASMPAANAGSLGQAFLLGAVLGLAAYGTYDVTNISTLKNWPVTMSLVDMAWGTALTSLSAATGYGVLRYVS